MKDIDLNNHDELNAAAETGRQYVFINKIADIVKERSRKKGAALSACVKTFGCQMNERDSEKLRGILLGCGYTLTDSEEADLTLYNTCTVRENANLKVYGRLGYLGGLKKKNPDMVIGLCGCMMQEAGVAEHIRESYRFTDLVFGTHNLYRFPELLWKALTGNEMVIELWKEPSAIVEDLPADRTYRFKSGVNIMFGCNNFCTYCIVPYVRGRERSREPYDILRETERLADDGVKEVMFLGQNVNSYGKTLADPVSFAKLLTLAEKIPGIERIRFMTSHPKDLSDELIDVMASSSKICPHLHLPLQSGSSALLKKMNRKYTKEAYLALTEKLRAAMPDISLTTDIIVGFPSETEEDFRETLDVVDRVGFDSAFTFIYSKRSGTPAAKMEDQVPEDIVHRRFDELLALVQKRGAEQNARFEGRTLPVLVEHVNSHDESLMTGRTPHNLLVHFPGDRSMIGRIVDVHMDLCKGFYYMGTFAG